jgi:hypothetical protein
MKSYQNGCLVLLRILCGLSNSLPAINFSKSAKPREGLRVFPCSYTSWIYRYLDGTIHNFEMALDSRILAYNTDRCDGSC